MNKRPGLQALYGVEFVERMGEIAAEWPLYGYWPARWPKNTMMPTSWRASCSENEMPERFKIGDHVSWNSEAGRVSGTIIAIHTSDFDYKGHVHHATDDDPQYEIKSDKTDHIAAHKGSALKRDKGA